MVKKLLVASAAAFAASYVIERWVIKGGPDDPDGFIMNDPTGIGLDDAARAVGTGLAVLFALKWAGS